MFIVPAPTFFRLHQETNIVRSCFVVGKSDKFNDEIQTEDTAANQSNCEPKKRRHIKFNNTLVNLTAVPIVGKPHICNINENTHHRIEEETHLGPPSGPDDEFAGNHSVQARKTNQRHGPEIGVLAVVEQLVISLEYPHWHVENDERMEEANTVLEQVVFPIVYSVLGSDVVQLWI